MPVCDRVPSIFPVDGLEPRGLDGLSVGAKTHWLLATRGPSDGPDRADYRQSCRTLKTWRSRTSTLDDIFSGPRTRRARAGDDEPQRQEPAGGRRPRAEVQDDPRPVPCRRWWARSRCCCNRSSRRCRSARDAGRVCDRRTGRTSECRLRARCAAEPERPPSEGKRGVRADGRHFELDEPRAERSLQGASDD